MTVMFAITIVCSFLMLLNLKFNPVAWIMIIALNCIVQYFQVPIVSNLLGGGYIGIVCTGIGLRQITDEKAL